MKAVKHLSHEELIKIVQTARDLLYLRAGTGTIEVYDPDSEWSGADICEALAGLLNEYELIPKFLGDTEE